MNAVEIAEAVAELCASAFNAAEFPFSFLEAYGNKEVTIKRLRSGNANTSDVPNGVLQRNNIHIATCDKGRVSETITALQASAKTTEAKAKFVLATDGEWLEALDLTSGEPLACAFQELSDHFAFFFALAGISVVKEIKENAIDIKATSRLNKLYVELLKENPDWGTDAKRGELNHFFARIIFCFFAEDTNIFHGEGLFTKTIQKMTNADGTDTAGVISALFETMNIKIEERKTKSVPLWADPLPYVNGDLFSGSTEVPHFTRTARAYLLRAGELNWRAINPDIFGSMIQAVAEDTERGALGLHYTSYSNILRVLNPLFLDDLRSDIENAADNKAQLLAVRNRMARIRVFDPACGSGNFLVIAYKEMRKLEALINQGRGEVDRASEIHLTNFRGIEVRGFAVEIARLALIIAEYQCDVLYRGERLALAEFLPLANQNWIAEGNALRLNWASVCPPRGAEVKVRGDDLFETALNQTEIDFENEGGETYICANPPYKGSQTQTPEQKADLAFALQTLPGAAAFLDYVSGWFVKATTYAQDEGVRIAFVTTNSICQGRQVKALWSHLLASGLEIPFAYTSFKWANLASHNAGVTVVIIGLSKTAGKVRYLYSVGKGEAYEVQWLANINPYLVGGPNLLVDSVAQAPRGRYPMTFGNMPNDRGLLLLDAAEARKAITTDKVDRAYIRRRYGAEEYIEGKPEYCIWVDAGNYEDAKKNKFLYSRFKELRSKRLESSRGTTQDLADRPYSFGEVRQTGTERPIILPRHTSENRDYFPVGLLPAGSIVTDSAIMMPDAPLWNLAIIASRIHLVWIGTVCGKLETRYRYSNTLGWNTFPIPILTENDKAELTQCAEDILLARERHWPATIADLYDPEKMPDDLRYAHERNDEVLERIYIGRRFKNDTERLEKLFEMYAKMTPDAQPAKVKKIKK